MLILVACGGSGGSSGSSGVQRETTDCESSISSHCEIGTSGAFEAAISFAGGVDFYRINVGQIGFLTMETTGDTDTNATLRDDATSRDDNGNPIASDKNSGEGSNFRIARFVFDGTYYIEVRGETNSINGTYVLRTSFEHPIPIGISASTNSTISSAADEDYYRVTVTESGILTVGVPNAPSLAGTLFNRMEKERFPPNSSLSKSVSPGTYYIGVKFGSALNPADYSFPINYGLTTFFVRTRSGI